jgi:hypothetical protein
VFCKLLRNLSKGLNVIVRWGKMAVQLISRVITII